LKQFENIGENKIPTDRQLMDYCCNIQSYQNGYYRPSLLRSSGGRWSWRVNHLFRA